MNRLASRKLWISVIASAIVAFGEEFGVRLDPEQVITLGGLVAAYVTGQALVDKQRVQSEVAAGVEALKLEANAIIAALNAKLVSVQAQGTAEAPEANTELFQGS